MTIEIPDDLARALEQVATGEHKSVQEVALERLRSFSEPPGSPQALLRAIRNLPHPSRAAVDELEAAIAANRLPVIDPGTFGQ